MLLQGLFDILRLSGSFEPVNLGEFGRKGGLSIIFSRKDGKVEGGRVIGQLKVANFARVKSLNSLKCLIVLKSFNL